MPIAVGGREHARRARRRGCRASRPRSTSEHMLAGVTIVDPEIDLDRAGRSSSSPTSTIHPFTVLRGRTRVAAGAEIGPHAVADRRRDRAGARRRPLLLPSPRHGARRRARRPARSWRSRTRDDRRAARRCRTSPTSATPRSARTRTSARATSPRTSRTSRAGRRSGRRSGATSGPASTMRSLLRSRLATMLGLRRGSVITEDVPPGSLAGFPPRQVTKEGYVRAKARRLS